MRTAITGSSAICILLSCGYRERRSACAVVFPPVHQDFGMTSQHDPTELPPILLITIDNNGNRWILSNILQALEQRAEASFGLCINRDVKRVVADRKTHQLRALERIAACRTHLPLHPNPHSRVRAPSAHITRGFVLWRLSDDGHRGSRP